MGQLCTSNLRMSVVTKAFLLGQHGLWFHCSQGLGVNVSFWDWVLWDKDSPFSAPIWIGCAQAISSSASKTQLNSICDGPSFQRPWPHPRASLCCIVYVVPHNVCVAMAVAFLSFKVQH